MNKRPTQDINTYFLGMDENNSYLCNRNRYLFYLRSQSMRTKEIKITRFLLTVALTVCSMTAQAQDPTPSELYFNKKEPQQY